MVDKVKLRYNRVLLKMSGEALTGGDPFGISPLVLGQLATELEALSKLNVQIGIVIGGGNMFRGATLASVGIDRVTADQMGMLATIMNALAIHDALEKKGLPTRIMSAMPLPGVVDSYDRMRAIRHLEKQRIVVFAAGTGNPLVTTDSAASLRAIEVKADVLLKATNVDGIYSADPIKDPKAKRYSQLTYDEALQKELAVMDLAAFCQCRDHDLTLRVFNFKKPGALVRIVKGEDEGTLVTN
jgi:uridylate kinase